MTTTLHVVLTAATFAGMVASGACGCYPMVLVAMAGLIGTTLMAMSHKADQRATARKEMGR